jgi:hypothetical protein
LTIDKFISVGIIPKINLNKDVCFFEPSHPCDPFINKAMVEKDVINNKQAVELVDLEKYLIP